jgi:glycosyltransferase involved in cell wall biosynthesis
MSNQSSWAVLVPAYREAARIADVVKAIRRHAPVVVVVDDGSDDATAEMAERAGATVLRHGTNRGKGAAMHTAFEHARREGYEFVIAMDGDGQHDPEEIPAFVEAYRRSGTPVLVGNRMADPRGMPPIRRLTNRFMSALLSRKMGQRVPDTQNGYRLYRCDVVPTEPLGSQRFAAESEILLWLSERGVKIGSVPTRVIYADEKSKIRPVRDTIRFFSMLRAWNARNRDAA